MKTDAQLQQDVNAELNWEPSVNAAQIGVQVRDSIVTLTGHVDSYGEKWNAERAAQRVCGVKALAVEIEVNLPALTQRNDADIARTVENALEWIVYLKKDSVKVMVEQGWVTLSGEVEWEYQRKTATAAMRYLMGVRGVSDQITIKPKATVVAIKASIESALKRRAIIDSQSIQVSVSGGDVTLSGSVQSWPERDMARHSAWGTPGVRHVIDNMTIV